MFRVGDLVTDTLSPAKAKWQGIVVHVESSNRLTIRVGARDFSYPISWLRHVEMGDIPKGERPMEDTREYLQSVTGGA